ncbi:MAG: MFS transporter [Salinivirgaceae bacterium]
MSLTKKVSTHNFYAFLWHAGFLAFAQNFMDIDTIIPAMLIESGGTAFHVGLMTAILLGGSSFTQLFFAPFISNFSFKKRFLLFGINTRVISLFGLGAIMFFTVINQWGYTIGLLFLFITTFAVAGAFTNISYTDILGKSVGPEKRKSFFSIKQVLAGVIVFGSAILARKLITLQPFPTNYGILFFIGASALLIASFGFWKIKETEPSYLKIKSLKEFFQVLKRELVGNKKLAYFLGFINTQGIAISFLPFVVLYAKQNFQAHSDQVGNFLLFKVIGIVLVSLLVALGVKKLKYNYMLYANVGLSLLLALMAFLINDGAMLKYLFVIGGLVYSLYTITMNGLLLEVSGQENRAIYAGFAGAGNLVPAIFPLIGGVVIAKLGFPFFFALYALIILMALYFIRKIDCQK